MGLVATVQFCPKFKDYEANLYRMMDLVSEAARKGAWLVALPELSTTGYSLMSRDEARPFAEDVHLQSSSETFCSTYIMLSLAKKLNVCIVWGFVGLESGTGDLYNSQAMVTPKGEVISYAKINRWGQDFCWAKAGRSNPPILKVKSNDDRFHRVGLLLCRDIRDKVNDKWTSLYEKGDADIVVLSANFGDGPFPATAWMDFVENNDCNLVVSNRYGKEANNNFGEGGVCVITKKGEVLCDGLTWLKDCIVYADL